MDNVPDIDAARNPLSRIVLEYGAIHERMVARAKQPGFTADDWAPLAELVAVGEFERVGAFLEVMNWREYTEFLTKFAASSDWAGTVRRVTELPGLVFLELEERIRHGGHLETVNSVTIYEFNKAGKICHLDVYLQRRLA
jgi:hypothetical protein